MLASVPLVRGRALFLVTFHAEEPLGVGAELLGAVGARPLAFVVLGQRLKLRLGRRHGLAVCLALLQLRFELLRQRISKQAQAQAHTHTHTRKEKTKREQACFTRVR